MSCPFALSGNSNCATPVTTSGYATPRSSVVTTVIRTAMVRFFAMFIVLARLEPGALVVASLREPDRGDNHVDQLDPDKRRHDAAQPVDEEIAAQQRFGAHRAVLN